MPVGDTACRSLHDHSLTDVSCCQCSESIPTISKAGQQQVSSFAVVQARHLSCIHCVVTVISIAEEAAI